MSKSKIEWTDETWNPVTGCTKVSQGCKNCYAEREWPRLQRLVPAYADRPFTDVRTHEDRLDAPLRWRRPRKVFVNSMSDLFHEDVPEGFIAHVFHVMRLCPQHTFQVLTKRPARMREFMKLNFLPAKNIWLGVSIEDQATADERIPLLLQTPAAVRWVSAEPLLGAVDLNRIIYSPFDSDWPCCWDALTGFRGHKCGGSSDNPRIDWVVVGGESGKNARPMHPAWVRSLRDQCKEAGVAFLFKQWGEWAPARPGAWFDPVEGCSSFGFRAPGKDTHNFGDKHGAVRVGKKNAGRLLDGVLHDEYPGGTK